MQFCLSYPVHATYYFLVMSLCSVTQEIREENHRNHEASHCVTFPFLLLLLLILILPVISKYSHLRFILIICSRLTGCFVPVLSVLLRTWEVPFQMFVQRPQILTTIRVWFESFATDTFRAIISGWNMAACFHILSIALFISNPIT